MRANPRGRAITAVFLVATVALGSGCGNQNDYETLKAATTGGGAVAADASDAAGAPQIGATAGPGVGQPAAAAKPVPAPGAGGAASPTGVNQPAAAPNKGGKPATTAPGGTAASGVCTKPLAPIKIGTVGHYSGIAGTLTLPGVKALQAFISSANAKGGVNCHPVELSVGDDGTDPATTQSLVRDFVENKGVIAFVHMGAIFTGETIAKYLSERRIPVIGDAGGTNAFNQHETYFPQMSTADDYVEGAFAMAGALNGPKGLKKLGLVVCLEAPICSNAYGIAADMAKKYGMELVYRTQISITAPNYTSTCLAAKNVGAEILWFGQDGNTDQRIARSCESVGYHPVYVSPGVAMTPAQATFPALAGLQVSSPVLPWLISSNPAMKEFLGALAKYAPGVEGSISSVSGWVSGLVFAEAAKQVGAQPTSDQILAGAFAIKNNNFGGMTRKLTYTKGAPNQRPKDVCWWAVEYHGPQVTSPNNGKETCR